MKSATKKVQAIGSEGAVAHIVYDLSLPLEERKAKAKRFHSTIAAARYLGVSDNVIINKRKVGKRIKKGDKYYAVRIASNEKI